MPLVKRPATLVFKFFAICISFALSIIIAMNGRLVTPTNLLTGNWLHAWETAIINAMASFRSVNLKSYVWHRYATRLTYFPWSASVSMEGSCLACWRKLVDFVPIIKPRSVLNLSFLLTAEVPYLRAIHDWVPWLLTLVLFYEPMQHRIDAPFWEFRLACEKSD